MKFIKQILTDKNLYQYIGTGVISAAVDFGVFMGLTLSLHTHYLVNNTISFILATFVNYFLCANVVFKHSQRYTPNIQLFLTYLVSLIGFSIQTSAVWIGIEYLILPIALAKFIAMGSGFLWNYLSRKYWVFAQTASATS